MLFILDLVDVLCFGWAVHVPLAAGVHDKISDSCCHTKLSSAAAVVVALVNPPASNTATIMGDKLSDKLSSKQQAYLQGLGTCCITVHEP